MSIHPKNPFFLAIFAAVIGAGHLAAASSSFVTGKDSKPADLVFSFQATTFDCTARDTLELAPGFAAEINDDTSDGTTALGSYSCQSWNEAGPEHIYRLDVSEDLELWAGLLAVGTIDHDLFLLDDCDTKACIAYANIEFSILLAPGTYYLIVDGYGSTTANQGPYTLGITCRWPGLPPQICQEGGAEALACADTPAYYAGDLLAGENLLQNYECGDLLERGQDLWYAVEVPAWHELTVEGDPFGSDLDLALWLFADCGATATCLGFADDKIAGQNESIVWSNESEFAVTVFCGVDSPRLIETAGQGDFTLTVLCASMVPNEKPSLGSVRALFR